MKIMTYQIANRMNNTPRSYIREILAATQDPDIISFAGGIPNPTYIDTEGIRTAADHAIKEDGSRALSYATTQGDPDLRKLVADRYQNVAGLCIDPDAILITNGSQQCLDLIGKVLINKKSNILIEQPGYLGAIQAFSLFEPKFHGIPLREDGPDTKILSDLLTTKHPSMMYGIPNSQNPSGVTYSQEVRQCIADLISETDTIFIEDDAYGEVRFTTERLPYITGFIPDNSILTGSFSKIVAPGLRMGWVIAPLPLMHHLVTAMQAAALHANYFSQRILVHYLNENNIDAHIKSICDGYQIRRDWMIHAIQNHMPDTVSYTVPSGGMFIWLRLPHGVSAEKIATRCIKEKVAVVPGKPFYTDGTGDDAIRLNFSNTDQEEIFEGIRRIGAVIRDEI